MSTETDTSLRFSLLELDDAPAAAQEWADAPDTTPQGVTPVDVEAQKPQPQWVGRLGGAVTARPGDFRRTKDHSTLDSLSGAMPEFKAEVSKVQLYTPGGLPMPSAYGTVRTYPDGTVEPLGTVGERYRVIQDREALSIAEPLCADGTIRNLDGGRFRGKIWLYGQSTYEARIDREDSVQARIIIANSHDGSIPWSIGFPCVRPVCQNTLAMALSSTLSKLLKIRHTAGAEQAVSQVRAAVEQFGMEFIEAADKMRALTMVKVTEDNLKDYVGYVFQPSKWADTEEDEETSRESRVYAKVLENYEAGAGARPGTAWGAYNAVTQYLTHDRSKGTDEQAFADLQWGNGSHLNRRAWDGAMEMLS